MNKHNEDWMVYIGIEVLGELGKQLFDAQSKPESSPLDLLAGLSSPQVSSNKADDIPFTLEEIESLLDGLQRSDLSMSIRTALRKARNSIKGVTFERSDQSLSSVISDVERIIFLKRVHFFHDVTINQLAANRQYLSGSLV